MTNSLFAPPALGGVLKMTGLPGGGSKIHDRSPYGNNGAITGAIWKRLPSGLWYLDFDGADDKVVTTNALALTGGAASVTLKAWVKSDNVAVDHKVAFGTPLTTDTKRLYIRHSSGNWKIYAYYDAGYKDLDTGIVATTAWTLLVITYDGTIRVYAYTSAAQSSWTDPAGAKTINLANNEAYCIGTYFGYVSGTYNWDGGIALPEVRNGIAWTAGQVANSFNQERHLFGVW